VRTRRKSRLPRQSHLSELGELASAHVTGETCTGSTLSDAKPSSIAPDTAQNYELRHSEWRLARAANVPRQRNGYDCGVFSLMCADYLAEGFGPDFGQQHIAHFRRRIVACCIEQRLP
jgi:hypothetical protein